MPVAAMPLNLAPEHVESVIALARQAGARIMDFYDRPIDVRAKDDRSPVTDADEAAEAVILPGLERLISGVAIISEEAASKGIAPSRRGDAFWLVDPLDGTKEFIKKNGEFTVNIALIENGTPRFGVVYLPATDTGYVGLVGKGATLQRGTQPTQPIAARRPPAEGLTVLASRSHANDDALDGFLATRNVLERISAGSSLKFCRVAEGIADLYPRFGRTMEWDTAAGQAVLMAAGGTVRKLDGSPLDYGKPGYENPHFIASGRES
jgi:3'(2'), 5'-bisphosphate nucleotidase